MKMAATATATVVTVPVKSAWYSKINWLAFAGAAISLLGTNALGLDAATQVKVMSVVQVVQSLGTIVLKTFFTPTVTPSSVK
jgi:hypothetical protein